MGHAFPQRLEQLVNESARNGRRVQVFNLAVNGYNTRQEVRAIELFGLSLKPDLVLVAYSEAAFY